MSIFGKKQTSDISHQIDKLYKELGLQIEVNQELKNENELLKSEVLSKQKEMARFEKNLRINPLSQLEILHQELSLINDKIDQIIVDQEESVKEKMRESVKEICTDSFELLNQLKSLSKKSL